MSKFKEIKDLFDTLQQFKLGTELHKLVGQKSVTEHLRRRNQLGVVARHGAQKAGEVSSQRSVFAAYKQNTARQLGVFILYGDEGSAIGLATVDPQPQLSRLRLPILPPRLAPSLLRQDESRIALAGPKISAWVAPSLKAKSAEALSAAYQALVQPDGPAHKFYERFASVHQIPTEKIQPWTIEPIDSPSWVHEAIGAAGLKAIGESARFDAYESQFISPPKSTLYVAV